MKTLDCETRSFTREEFYDFVWSAPATKLASEIGCSDVMIGKICKSHDIPKPYSGYWAKLAHGKQPAQTSLPKNTDARLQTLVFYKHPKAATTLNEPPRECEYDKDIQDALNKSQSLGPVKVAKTLRSAHPLIVTAKNELKRRRAQDRIPWMERDHTYESKRVSILDVNVSEALEPRALRIMDALIKRLQKVGGTVEILKFKYDSQTIVKFAEDKVTQIRLREKSNQVKVVNNDAKYEWERNRTELVPSGILLIDDGPSSYKTPYLKDNKKLKIEDGLGKLVDKLIREAGDKRVRQRKQEERERIEAAEAKIRRERAEKIRLAKLELERLQTAEQVKVDKLTEDASRWRQAKVLREYLQALADSPATTHIEFKKEISMVEFLKWGFDQADRIDPMTRSPTSVLDEFVDIEMFD